VLAQHAAVGVTLLERAVGSEREKTHGPVRAGHDRDSYYTSPFHARALPALISARGVA